MSKSPTMKQLIEDKITEEKATLQMEVLQIQQEKQVLEDRVTLAEQALNDILMGV